MIRTTILFCLISISCWSYSQSAREILQASYEKCQSITHGHYVMLWRISVREGVDTSIMTLNYHFRKLENDAFYPALFSGSMWMNDTLRSRGLYTGDALVRMTDRDSIALVRTVAKWPDEIKSRRDGGLFEPFVNNDSEPLLSCMSSPNHEIEYISAEEVRGKSCHHIRVVNHPDQTHINKEVYQNIKATYDLWIGKADAIPWRYSVTSDVVWDGDTTQNYFMCELKGFELNPVQDPAIFTMASIPEYYTIKDYVPFPWPDPLQAGVNAPDWSYRSTMGERMSLYDQRGHIVLLDFFYNACHPCILAFPSLQSLHEKYSDHGLRVIGINPFDSVDKVAALMEKHGVTYPVLLGTEKVAKDYAVSGYPTIYLIGRNGKVIHVKSGFGFNMMEQLETIIKRELGVIK